MRVFLVASGAKTPPTAPSSLTAPAVSSSRIDLAWTNNALLYDGTKIERSTDGVNFTEITDVASGVTTYSSTGLSASTQYYYRVRAYKGALNSAYSNTANATTQVAQVDRIIEIDTRNIETGSSANNQFRLVVGAGSNYNVDWGDGTSQTGVTATTTTKTYTTAGIYDIKLTGVVNHQVINNTSSDRLKYTKIKQWGSSCTATTLNNAFFGCVNLRVTATDSPNLTGCTNTQAMFRSITALGSFDASGWNTSSITSMANMFQSTNFNGNITTWNTASVTTMQGMFQSNASFNQNIGSWNVGNVTNFASMFQSAISFNQNIGAWNVSNATDMTSMFQTASSFNQNLSSWNVGKVTNFLSCFTGASAMSSNTSVASWRPGTGLTGTTTFNMSSALTISSSTNIGGDFTSFNMIRCFHIGSMLSGGNSNHNYGVWDIRNVQLATSFMANASTIKLSASNLAGMYIGWATQPVQPLTISFGTAKYDASGTSARAILSATRAVGVTGATDPNANGTYTWNGTRYQNANGWYFAVASSQWNLYNPSNVSQAVTTGSFPLQHNFNPMSGQGWTGANSGIVLTLVGAGWTITDGGQL